jgi:hypothetical protein
MYGATVNKHLDPHAGTQNPMSVLAQAVQEEKGGKLKIPAVLVTAYGRESSRSQYFENRHHWLWGYGAVSL